MLKTYQYPGYFLTTDQIPEDSNYIASWEVTPEEAVLIEEGANIEVVDDLITILPQE